MDLTIIVPTYNEKENPEKLVQEIQRAMGQETNYEILFVDDSTDETPQFLNMLSKHCKQVRFIHRRNTRGLASAVVEGFRLAEGTYIVVMDADLQHPPALLPLMLERLHTAEIVIPSRFIEGGSDGGLNVMRKFVSWTARMIGRWVIKRLRVISDCTSGYFGLHRRVIEGVKLEPVGWKILMEVLVKGKHETVHEIPYTFAARSRGHSKMNLGEQWNYLRHVLRLLRSSPEDLRLFFFCIIGFVGVFVNIFTLTMLVNVFQIPDMAASMGASLVAMLHNYVLNDRITWREVKKPHSWRRVLQMVQFVSVSSLGIMVTAFIAQGFVSLGWSLYVGQLAGTAAATYWNYVANDQWTWSNVQSTAAHDPKPTVTRECFREIS